MPKLPFFPKKVFTNNEYVVILKFKGVTYMKILKTFSNPSGSTGNIGNKYELAACPLPQNSYSICFAAVQSRLSKNTGRNILCNEASKAVHAYARSIASSSSPQQCTIM